MSYIEKYYQWIFLSIISLTIILLLVAYYIGISEEKQFVQEQVNYNYAIQLIEENEYSQGLQILEMLQEVHGDNHLVIWQKGWAHAQLGELEEGLSYFIKAQEINPVLTREPSFLLQFSWTMINAGRYEEAKVYLEHSRNQAGITEEQLDLVDEWLEYILEQEATA